eukprot:gene1564-gene1921
MANVVIRQGWYKGWRDAEIMALWKKRGAKGDPKMYRPIALLLAVSRVVEKLISRQLKAHLRAAGVVPAFQYGFQPGLKCEDAITHLTSLVAAARDRGEVALVAPADCSAAFDTVLHELPLPKLEKLCGIEGDALRVISSHLEGRGERCSQWQRVPCGVPQGSVWGVLLFTLYTADIGKYVTAADIVMYADDITMVVGHKDSEVAKERMNTALNQLAAYAKANRIAPGPTKAQLLVSAGTKKLKMPKELACEMGAQEIRPVKVIKVLGVLLDDQLAW